VDGVAVYTDKSKNTAKMHYLREDGKELDITFIFNGNNVDVSANDLICEYGGANVSLLGSFKKI
jgi:acetolactate synthase small subunit